MTIEERLDDAWNHFLMILGDGFRAESTRWPDFLKAIRDIRGIENELVSLSAYDYEYQDVDLCLLNEEERLSMLNAEERAAYDKAMQARIQERRAFWERIKAIPCSHCGAVPGEVCVLPSGQNYNDLHSVRRQEATRRPAH